LGEILNSQNLPKILPKVLAKLSAIFRLLPELFPCPPKQLVEKLHLLSAIFIFFQNFEITIFAEILNIAAKFQKYLVCRAKFRETFP